MSNARRTSADDLRKKAEQKHKRKGVSEAASLYEQAAVALIGEGRQDEAVAMLSQALASNGHHGDASSHQQRELRRLLAETLKATRKTSAAISEYEEYIKLGTPDAASLRALADLYVAAGKPKIAIERLRRAIDRSIGEGDVAGASDAAALVAELLPESLEAAVQHAALLRNINAPRLIEALDRLAALYQQNEKLSQEVGVCREILALDSARQDVRRRLTSLYTQILEMDPHDDEAWQGLRVVDPDLAEQIAVLLMDELSEKHARSKAG